MLTQKETRLKKQGSHFINLMSQEADKDLKMKTNKFKKRKQIPAKVPQTDKKEQKVDKCHFCKKVGYYQKDCQKCKTSFEKKDKSNALYVSNQT